MAKIKFAIQQACRLLPERQEDAHKAMGGRTLIIAGSKGMPGAALLCATAAARVGSGYVSLLSQEKTISLRSADFLLLKKLPKDLEASRFTAVAIGPGLGKSRQAFHWVQALRKMDTQNVVVDADALNLSSEKKIRSFPPTWILTPHEAELARLLGVKSSEIRRHREESVKRAQKKFGCVVLLKGFRTLIATRNELIEIQSGNRALAKAGTGDVLTGMIAGFLAQGLGARDAGALAAFVHGRIADDWSKNKDYLSLMASDLLAELPHALHKLRKKNKTRHRDRR